MSRFLFGAILLMNWTSLAEARTFFVGTASVIDGDTIEIHGERICLFGVDPFAAHDSVRSLSW